MSTQHTDDGRIDRDHYEDSPSTGWRETREILHLERFIAMTRTDRPEQYRRKHRRGVSS